jgi:Mysoin-binding motif of peroxisomes
LDKYNDIYDISTADLEEADRGYSETDFDGEGTLKNLKILLYRLHTTRRVFLCCLLALDADGGKPDFARWRTAVDEIERNEIVMKEAEETLKKNLVEEERELSPPISLST